MGLLDVSTKTAGILQVSGLRIWGFEMGLLDKYTFCPLFIPTVYSLRGSLTSNPLHYAFSLNPQPLNQKSPHLNPPPNICVYID